MKKYLFLLLSILTLAGCSSNNPELPQNAPTPPQTIHAPTLPQTTTSLEGDSRLVTPSTTESLPETTQGCVDVFGTGICDRKEKPLEAPTNLKVEHLGPSSHPLGQTAAVFFNQLDYLGRPTGVEATLTASMQRTSDNRPKIKVDPPGFNNRPLEYGWLYHRSHLIAYTLYDSPLTEKAENIITGTQHLNQVLMMPLEEQVRTALKQYPLVTYVVIPHYEGEELVARYLTIDIVTPNSSDSWKVPNVQPGYVINYLTGESERID